ncbi:MAG: M43 family zinc metalloprotease [Cytophagales bacterium]|nr:M43 family zinc metalloprotease [Bernardetiaceae bacterium]MDW8203847.1 M43 family zinc metalloprotease [Cytophagales bacterium]
MKKWLTSVGLCWVVLSAAAQQEEEMRCGLYHSAELRQKMAYFFEHVEKLGQVPSNTRTENIIYRIPLIFHVFHYGEPIGTGTNISAAQIYSQIEVLNEDFRRLNANRTETLPEFQSVAADVGIEFYPAAYDSAGRLLPERGIRRYQIQRIPGFFWTNETLDRDLKPQTIWDPTRYLNIWVIDSLRLNNRVGLAYAQFPDLSSLQGLPQQGGLALTDGLVIRYNRIGSFEKVNVPQLARGPYNLGRTLTHEMGHFLGLLHPFDGYSCNTDGDFCPDTPPTNAENFRCNLNVRYCSNSPTPTMIQNYMDFTDDFCMNLFTQCQAQRMRRVLEVSPRRRELVTSTVGLEAEELRAEVRVYPNPTRENLTVEIYGAQPIAYRLYDIWGREVEAANWAAGYALSLSLSGKPKGLYLLQVNTLGGGVIMRRVVIE